MLKLSLNKNMIEAGCDEAGRGCLAGPVFAAAVILPDNFHNDILNDSKILSANQRNELRIIIEEQAVSWAVANVDNEEIDDINILNASILAMHKAIDKLTKNPEFLLIDGNRFKSYKKIPHECIVKGDGKYAPIAAASILAKTHRDEFMQKLHQKFPHYFWNTNMGYPTKQHKRAITLNGITPHHRKSFNLNEQMKINL